jgi:hypothetical protein
VQLHKLVLIAPRRRSTGAHLFSLVPDTAVATPRAMSTLPAK